MGRGFTSFTKGKCDEVGDGWRIPHILMIFDDCIGLYSRKRSCGSAPGRKRKSRLTCLESRSRYCVASHRPYLTQGLKTDIEVFKAPRKGLKVLGVTMVYHMS